MDKIFYESKHGIGSDYFSVESGNNFSYPLHMHRCWEIILLLHGSMGVTVEKDEYIIHENDMILIKPGRIHSLTAIGDCRHILCIFSPELISAVSEQLWKYRLTSPLIRNMDAKYREFFLAASEKDNIATVKGLLYLICGLFYTNLDFSEKDDSIGDDTLLHKIFDYVETNPDKPCTLYDMANLFGYDYAYLSRMFASGVGMPYHHYVRNIKINRACYLLRNTRDSVISIASRCGYSSLCSFNRSFKSVTGKNPTEYRGQSDV